MRQMYNLPITHTAGKPPNELQPNATSGDMERELAAAIREARERVFQKYEKNNKGDYVYLRDGDREAKTIGRQYGRMIEWVGAIPREGRHRY